MRLTKIDLKNLVAVGHNGERLGLLIDRGDEIEYLEILAPKAAEEGLIQVAEFAQNPTSQLAFESKPFAQLPASQSIPMQSVQSSTADVIDDDESQQLLQIELD